MGFFQKSIDRQLLVYTCHYAMRECHLYTWQEAFLDRQQSNAMRYIRTGLLLYNSLIFDESIEVYHGSWVSHPSLWVKWVHAGDLVANSVVVLVDIVPIDFHILI